MYTCFVFPILCVLLIAFSLLYKTVFNNKFVSQNVVAAQVNGYLNNKDEIYYKKIIWEEMNKEYLEVTVLFGNNNRVSVNAKYAYFGDNMILDILFMVFRNKQLRKQQQLLLL